MTNFEGLDAETCAHVLEQTGHFASDILASLNASGDRQGCRYQEDRVLTPDGFAEAYQAFVEGGLTGLDWTGMLGRVQWTGYAFAA